MTSPNDSNSASVAAVAAAAVAAADEEMNREEDVIREFKGTPIFPSDDWLTVWSKLEYTGWTRRFGDGLMMDYYFILPHVAQGWNRSNKGTEGVDYLTSQEAVLEYCEKTFGWDPKGAEKARLKEKKAEGEDEEGFYDWINLWPRLKNAGWTYTSVYVGSGRISWYYVRPGWNLSDKNAQLGVDYFGSELAVVEYCKRTDIAESSSAAAAGKRTREEELEHARAEGVKEGLKKTKTSVCAAAQNLVCAISRELPVEPVTAEDGFLYEEREIKEWIRKKGDAVTSPRTNEPMGKKLFPAVQVRNTIKDLVNNGVIDGDLADQWKEGMKTKEMVAETKKLAEEGDADAMYCLGAWYGGGHRGLSRDKAEAYKWFKKSADLSNVRGMANAGFYLLNGWGGAERNGIHGAMLMLSAAERGSDHACANVARLWLYGNAGVPKDKEKAKYWFKRAVDGSCAVKHLNGEGQERAKRQLRELEDDA